MRVLYEKLLQKKEKGEGRRKEEEEEIKTQLKREGDVVGVDAWTNAVQLETLMVSDPRA